MKRYKGKLEMSVEPDNPYTMAGNVITHECVVFCRQVPYLIHEITQALEQMKPAEQIKVMEYITEITDKRITFELLIKDRSRSMIDFYRYPEKFGIK